MNLYKVLVPHVLRRRYNELGHDDTMILIGRSAALSTCLDHGDEQSEDIGRVEIIITLSS